MIPLLTVISLFAAALWWTRRRLVRVDVTGPSMLPTLNPGDVVLARRTTGRRLRPGRIVVAEAPPDASQPGDVVIATPADRGLTPTLSSAGRSWVLKRVAAVHPNRGPARGDPALLPELPPGTVYLLGDNADASSDSRHLGPVPVEQILGVVVCRLREARGCSLAS